jgi:hypothetical protein
VSYVLFNNHGSSIKENKRQMGYFSRISELCFV